MKVEVPDEILLQIATYGNLGTGELGDYIRRWASKICNENGLSSKLREMQDEKLRELRNNLKNVLGPEAINKMDSLIIKSTEAMKIVMKDKTEIDIN